MLTIELPVAGVEVWVPGIILMGVLIGVLTGLFGVGGGFLLTPCLRIFFCISYPVAVGTTLLQIFITGSISAAKHWRAQNVDFRLGSIMAAGAVCGAEIGKSLMDVLVRDTGTIIIFGREHVVLDLVMNVLFLLVMVVVAVSILRETVGNRSAASEEVSTSLSRALHRISIPPVLSFAHSGIPALSLWVPLFISLFVGVMTGLMGVGGGFVMLPLLIYVLGVPTTVAVGTSAFQIIFASGYGAFVYYRASHVELLLALLLVLGSVVSVHFGVLLSQKLGGRNIRRYFVVVIGLGVVMILYSLIRDICFDLGG